MTGHRDLAEAIAAIMYPSQEECPEWNDFRMMPLAEFICQYSEQLEEYFDEDFGSGFWYDLKKGPTMIMCYVDCRKGNHVPNDIRKKIKKAGKTRRNKLKDKWSYVNPMNRILGYIAVKDVTNEKHPEKLFSLSAICSTTYTEQRGIGKKLMDTLIEWCARMGATDLVLEVANEWAGMECEEESDEECEEESEEEWEEEEDEEEEEEEDTDAYFHPDEDATSVIVNQLWRKCMRKTSDGQVVYNLDEEYIADIVEEYFEEEEGEIWEGYDKRNVSGNPKGNEYGGEWYKKGRESNVCSRLMSFYEMWGFKEDPKVNLEFGCYSEVPYPSMRLDMKNYHVVQDKVTIV
jgi:ribosomal protein S18 acetylase RimI-like enzyme